jgi:hypothetical protein
VAAQVNDLQQRVEALQDMVNKAQAVIKKQKAK